MQILRIFVVLLFSLCKSSTSVRIGAIERTVSAPLQEKVDRYDGASGVLALQLNELLPKETFANLTNKSLFETSSTTPDKDPKDLDVPTSLTNLTFGFIAVSIVLLQVIALFSFGQPLISKSGRVKRWDGDVQGSENSQHLTDWYTFTHVLHGFLFYALTALIVPSWSVKSRFLIALGTEGGWEIIENTPQIIQRYRKTGLAQGYTGDSIVNSICDTLAMSLGFVMTYFLPVWATVGIAVAEEIIVGFVIRDNLTLNIIQLIYPFEIISRWQTRTSTETATSVLTT